MRSCYLIQSDSATIAHPEPAQLPARIGVFAVQRVWHSHTGEFRLAVGLVQRLRNAQVRAQLVPPNWFPLESGGAPGDGPAGNWCRPPITAILENGTFHLSPNFPANGADTNSRVLLRKVQANRSGKKSCFRTNWGE